ncbi:MAG: TIGR02757 family protein [Flavobacteriaceae bacterium TMED120]|nr:MAG: TIGR02757 family protein [Flavobacteriaceae bacterium TMED120]
MNPIDLKSFLDEKAALYEHPRFIDSDPIQIPHQFTLQQDIEIAAFLTATIAWGNRKSILSSAQKMMQLMGNTPYSFVMTYEGEELPSFAHRTFNSHDLAFLCLGLQKLYHQYENMNTFFKSKEKTTVAHKIDAFRTFMLQVPHEKRSEKHLSNPNKGSAAKRLNMFFRWMVRSAKAGVDFGLWTAIKPKELSIPLDVHTGNVARKLGLLKRKQSDRKAMEMLDAQLRIMDPKDPVKYDFALFGLGVFEKF